MWRDVAGVRLLLSLQADVNLAEPHFGRTPLFTALMVFDEEILRLLLTAGAKVNHRDRSGQSALWYALRHPLVLRMLIEAGANVNSRDFAKNTALMSAMRDCIVPAESVRLLLEAGANVNLRNEKGETALSILFSQGPDFSPWQTAQTAHKRLLLEQAGATI